ncbi:histidine kinase [Bacillus sp. FJAT-27225]|uniref:sensor histidine kinase n=1 Tax=Bacillus sp. FJAT-27225 TaxID=1743144 RepID=UPI00080C2503|nr:sensor histidine kinase [Bacillus sp. FJAT-27225]OCA82281.1 histidine kinase [Bacillus sp. FJAT-27225]
MFKEFLIERKSWIAMFVALELLSLFIAYIDPTIPIESLLYIVFLSSCLFLVFLFYRYHKETRFYKSLKESDINLNTISSIEAGSSFEKLVKERIILQSTELKKDLSLKQHSLEQKKDELLSWIHEVKTPLTAMQLIIDRIDNKDSKASLQYEWLRIHLLLDQQLHQKRIPFMENDLYIEKTDLRQIVSSEIKTLQSWCMQKGIGFEIEFESSEVLTDAKWAAFIIRQLLTNAVKYSETTDITIRGFEHDGNMILEIEDFGRGIPARDLPRIFDKGYTSTSKHHDNKASGMGLYLAKKAATPLLISIDVISTPGEGSVFTLTFPKRNAFNELTGV